MWHCPAPKELLILVRDVSRVSWKPRPGRAGRQLLLAPHFPVKETKDAGGEVFWEITGVYSNGSCTGTSRLFPSSNALLISHPLILCLTFLGCWGRWRRKQEAKNPLDVKKLCLFRWYCRIPTPVLLLWDFPKWNTSLIGFCTWTWQRPQPIASDSLQTEGAGFSIWELRIPAFGFSLLVALELCPVSTAFWQRSNTLSASRNRYFCSTNEPRFIDSRVQNMRWEITNPVKSSVRAEAP